MKIVDKIQKLLALTESSNEHEAALAAEKAHELLAEHNLSMAQVESASKKEKLNEQVGHTSATSKLGARWVRNLWLATARLYFCEYLYSRGNHKTYHTVIGSEANTTTACHMAEFFTQSVVEMSKGSSSQSSFRTGCALRLVARLNEMRKLAQEQPVTASNKSNLPALYEQTKEQLDKIQATINNINRTKLEIGTLETRKHEMMHIMISFNEDLTLMQKELEKDYGTFDVDIKDGTINYKE